MIQVGLTGNAASGKSTVARIWSLAGVPVVSSDELAREVVQPGSPGWTEIREAFGDEVFTAAGPLDRARLRAVVFQDAEARRRLEEILHPRIAEARRRWIESRRLEGEPLVVSEIPLLFEVGSENEFDVIVVVDAPREERLRRLVEERGLASDEAQRILASQGDPAAKRAAADFILENRGSREMLEGAALRLLEELRRGASDSLNSGTPTQVGDEVGGT